VELVGSERAEAGRAWVVLEEGERVEGELVVAETAGEAMAQAVVERVERVAEAAKREEYDHLVSVVAAMVRATMAQAVAGWVVVAQVEAEEAMTVAVTVEVTQEAEKAWVVVVVEEVPEGDGMVEEERGRVPRVGAVKVVAVTEAET
jgi:hypothetical protein